MATITAIKDKINRLNQAEFQILCDDYLSRIGYPNLVAFGTMAGAEKTTPGTPDTYGCSDDGKYIFAEYTTQRDGLVRKIKSDLEKCLDESKTHVPVEQISEIVYCHTSSNISPGDDLELKRICSDRGVLLTLIGIDQLADALLRGHRILAKDHLGLSIDTEQIQTADDFINQYDSNALAAPLNTIFLARDSEMDEIETSLSKENVVIVTGPAGVGKTRLSLAFARKHSEEHAELLYCIHNRAQSLYDDWNLYFDQPNRYFILIDDANQISDLSLIIDLISRPRTGFSFKVLITVRDYATEKVRNSLQGKVHYEEVQIHPLKDDQIKEIVKRQFGILNSSYLDRIAAIAEGNARIAMLAGKIALDANRLDSINDASALYEEYYGPVLRDTMLNNDTSLLASAGITAFLETIHLDYIDPILSILADAGISKDIFIDNLFRLSDLEIVDIYHDKAVKFSEQSFANYILKYVFCDKRLLPLSQMLEVCFFQSQQRTMNAVNALLRVYRSENLYDFVGAEIKAVWSRLKDDDPQKFQSFLKSFYLVNPTEALCLLKKTIEDMPPARISADEIDTENGRHYQNVSDEIITILNGFSDHEDLESALDLFFQYYLKRPDKYIQFFHAATSAFCIKLDSIKNDFRTQILFFSKLIEYADNWKNDYILLLFFDIIEEFLKVEFSPCETARDGKNIIMYRIILSSSEGVSAYRAIIWDHLEQIAKLGKRPELLRKVLSSYGNGSACDVIREEAPSVCKVIHAGLISECLDDCIIVEQIADRFEKCGASANELQYFLCNPLMEAYQLLCGPDYTPDYDMDRQQSEHRKWVQQYFASKENKPAAFSYLYDTFCSVKDPEYTAITGINLALRVLADDKNDFVSAARYCMEKGDCEDIDHRFVVRSLFSYLSTPEVKRLIHEASLDSLSANRWMFAYYSELPQEWINEEQLLGLYQFLEDDSDKTIGKSSFRDISFLQKYLPFDSNVFIKASKVLLARHRNSSFFMNLYFEQLTNPYHQNTFDIIEVYQDDIGVLEDIYFSLLQYGFNADFEGNLLLQLVGEDPSFPRRLAAELLQKKKTHSLHDTDSRYAVLYELDHYCSFIDEIINDAIEMADYPFLYLPDIIKLFLVLPSKRKDYEVKRNQWLQHYIQKNADNSERMDCIFDAVSECTDELRKKCIEQFISTNPSFDAFQKLPILPRSFGGFGSFVPIYKGWIDFLESLLPLFHGIDFLAHKRYILEKIDAIRGEIVKEEISNIIQG